jgi:hypothetical protein
LSQFLLRLAFGLAVGMAITSPQKVFSGFFRNHLYVTLGLTTLAALVLAQSSVPATVFATLAAAISFIAAAAWLYEAKRLGMTLIAAVAGCSLLAALYGSMSMDAYHAIALVISGLVLGITFAAMLLGHWYLNAPGMELAPLRRLLVVAAIVIAGQMFVVGAGLIAEVSYRPSISFSWLLFVVLRWSFGLFGVLGLLWMAWQTLKIPNTQSATGILYVAVIGVFIGELTGLLLSAESTYPL